MSASDGSAGGLCVFGRLAAAFFAAPAVDFFFAAVFFAPADLAGLASFLAALGFTSSADAAASGAVALPFADSFFGVLGTFWWCCFGARNYR